MAGTFHFQEPLWLDVTPSTNDFLKKAVLSDKTATSGSVVAARRQTAGRGRMGASWLSGGGGDLLFSFAWWGRKTPEEAGTLTLAVGLAVRDFLAGRPFSIDSRCKWPNDVLVDGGKICGILAEGSVDADNILKLVVGIGINIMHDPARTAVLDRPVTSVEAATGRRFDPEEVLPLLLDCLESRVNQWLAGGFAAIRDDLTRQLWGVGKAATVRLGGEQRVGIVEGINDKGELLLCLGDNELMEVASVTSLESF